MGLTEVIVITNQMVFEKKKLEQMLVLIGVESNNLCYHFLNLLKDVNYKFSEYQLYYTFLFNHSKIEVEKVKIFRRFDLIDRNINDALKKYNLISYEVYHKNDFLRFIKSKLYYILNLNYG